MTRSYVYLMGGCGGYTHHKKAKKVVFIVATRHGLPEKGIVGAKAKGKNKVK